MTPTRIILAVAAITASGLATACSSGSQTAGQALEQTASNQSQTIAEDTLPAPVFPHSEIRYAFIQDEAAQALGSQTTTFVWNQGQDPKPLCPSIGFPIPDTAQLTNPQKAIQVTSGSQGNTAVTVGNIDPSQIYPPPTSSGDYVLCVNRQGQPYTVFVEPNVVAVAGAATVVNGSIQESGAPTMPTCKVTSPGTKQAKTICTK